MKRLAVVFAFLMPFIFIAPASAVSSISEIQGWTLVKDEGKVLEFSSNGKGKQLWIWTPLYEVRLPAQTQLVYDDGSDIQEWEKIETLRRGVVLHAGLDRKGPVLGGWYWEVTQRTITKIRNGIVIDEYTGQQKKSASVFFLRHPDGRETSGTNLSIEDVKDEKGAIVDYELELKTAGGVVKEMWKQYFEQK